MGTTRLATHFWPGLRLLDEGEAPANDTAAPAAIAEFKWIHCANEGEYLGHHQGAFNLTRAVFETFVKNFRGDPQYKPGELDLGGGKKHAGGVRPVLQFDYEHASEMPPWEGSIAQSGAPACGWVLDVELREGPGGKAQLWAFAQLLPKLREQIGGNEQRFVSIAFTLEGTHWITGDPIGPCLTSIAITNHPFMRDLEPLAARAASQRSAAGLQRKGTSGAHGGRNSSRGAPMSAEEQLAALREQYEALRKRVCTSLGIRLLADDAAIGDAVDEVSGSTTDLKAILEVLGVAGGGDAVKQVTDLKAAYDRGMAALTELASILGQDAAMDQGLSKNDVAAAMRASKLPGEGAERALGTYRAHCIELEVKKLGESPSVSKVREARARGRERFLTEYGVSDETKRHLTETLVSGPGDKQVTPPRQLSISDDQRGGSGAGDESIDLTPYRGNTTQRLMAHLEKTDPTFKSLSLDRKVARAGELRLSGVELILPD